MSSPKLPTDLSPDEKRAMLAELLKRKASQAVTEAPASYGQRALWFIYQLDPSSSAYNVAVTVRVRSRVDIDALRRAIGILIRRHASLRTTFRVQGGEPLQVVREYIEAPFETVDVAGGTEGHLRELVLSAHRVPYDLESGPAFRAALFTIRDDDHVLLIGAHHSVVDGRSLGVLLEELVQVYSSAIAGTEPLLPPVAYEYTTFADWQSRMLREQGAKLEAFWREVLANPLPVLELPGDRPRPAIERFRGDAISFELPAEVAAGLKSTAKAEGVTLFNLLVAAYCVLLHRYSGQTDLVIGCPAIGRTRAEFERVVGYFVNPIAIRVNLTGDPTVKALLARVRGVVQGALAHQDFPFPLLVERLQPERASNRPPVFQVMFNLMRIDMQASVRAGAHLALESYTIPQEEGQFDLALDVAESGDRLVGMLRYRTDLFDRETVDRMFRHYRTLLTKIVQSSDVPLSELSVLDDEDLSRFAEWNATAMPYDGDEGVEAMFVAQARRVPEAVAVEGGGGQLRYRELDEASNRLAWRLREAGVGPDSLVGVCLQRTPDLLVALLGILKAGGAYVPLDPAFPAQRLALMAEDAQLRLILTDEESRAVVPSTDAALLLVAEGVANHPATLPPPLARGDHLAYVLYTSGSTGKPKGVQVPRRAFTNFIRAMQQQPGLAERDVLLAVTTLSFDISGLELFLPLTVGARVVIATRDQASDGQELQDLLASTGATLMQATPATWRLLIDAGWTGSPTLSVLCGGEALPAELAAQLLERCGALWNMYGPTETTVWSTLDRVTSADRITVGRPIGNTQIYIVDEQLRQVPAGLRGEVCIAGDGVARGYLNRAELTAEKFVRDPFSTVPGARMYRTGDLGRWLPDGRLDVAGRADQQVKLRGFRIELGEIEAVLERHDAIRQAVASVFDDGLGDRRLVAYVVHAPGVDATASELRRFLRRDLPDYMVPSLFIPLDTLPLTPNGKVDRKALPAPLGQQRRRGEVVAPRTEMEQRIAALWTEAVGARDVSVFDNFFDIGGHSLLSLQVIARLEQQIGVRLNPTRFVMDTLEQIAAACEQMQNGGKPV